MSKNATKTPRAAKAKAPITKDADDLLNPLPKTVERRLPKGTIIDGIDCSGMIDDGKKEGIPVWMQTQNRPKVSPEVQAKIDADAKRQQEQKVVDFHKPKGMSVEEWEDHKNRQLAATQAKRSENLKALREQVAAEKAVKKAKDSERLADTFTLRDEARKRNLDPRKVRAVARACKDKLAPMQVAKHTFNNKDLDNVWKIIEAGLTEAGTKKATGKKGAVVKKTKVKLPPPGEAVFSSKAKVKRATSDAPTPASKKADDRKAIKQEMKGRKKIKVEDGAMYVKRLKRPAAKKAAKKKK